MIRKCVRVYLCDLPNCHHQAMLEFENVRACNLPHLRMAVELREQERAVIEAEPLRVEWIPNRWERFKGWVIVKVNRLREKVRHDQYQKEALKS